MKKNGIFVTILILLLAILALTITDYLDVTVFPFENDWINTENLLFILVSITILLYLLALTSKNKKIEKKRSQQKKSHEERNHSVLEFNQLEEELLSANTMSELYERATNWLLDNFPLTYVSFSLLNPNNKLSIEYYKENIPSEEFLLDAVTERVVTKFGSSPLVHSNHTYSVPYSRKGNTLGYLFIGYQKSVYNESKWDVNPIGPFIRIFNTACIVVELVKTKEQRSHLQKAFSSYVPSELVESYELNPSLLRIGGEYETLSIMFTDLQGFTTLSQKMNPSDLIKILNEYFSEMSGVIERFGGTVSKLVGDGILAFFRSSDTDGNHVERCCEAALIMKKYELILNSKLIENGMLEEPLFTRIGISTGEVILGNVGSEKRLDYTIMGPEVNLASRIEQANKKLGTSVLISYETYLKVKDSFVCEAVAYAKLKGFKEPVQLYELISKIDTSEPILLNTQDIDEIEYAEEAEFLEEI